MSDAAAFLLAALVAIAVGWPTWIAVSLFALAIACAAAGSRRG